MVRAFLPLVFALPALAAPVTFSLDPGKTELLAFTTPTGLFKDASHSHVVRAHQVTGEIVYDAESPGASRVSVSFPVSALVVDDPGLRQREGLHPALSERDREDVTRSMLSLKQLDVQRFREISFESTQVARRGEGRLEVTGRLGIHGVRKTVTLPVTYAVEGDSFRGEGELTIEHRDFGIWTFSALMGTVRNSEAIRLKIVLVGRARKVDIGFETAAVDTGAPEPAQEPEPAPEPAPEALPEAAPEPALEAAPEPAPEAAPPDAGR